MPWLGHDVPIQPRRAPGQRGSVAHESSFHRGGPPDGIVALGEDAPRLFDRDAFIPSWPDDLRQASNNRVVGDGQIVDEIRLTFTHDRPMEWFLPGVPPTHRALDIVVAVQFRDGKLASERISWDRATVLRQVRSLKDGLLRRSGAGSLRIRRR